MGNHKMGHRQSRINSASPRMSEAIVVEIWRQPIGIEVIQSPNVIITTTTMEMMVAPSANVVKGRVRIGSITNLGNGSSGVSAGRNLNKSSTLPTTITTVV